MTDPDVQKTALIPIADGSEDLESVTLIDVLRRAGVTVTVASIMPDSRLQITAARGTRIVADCHIEQCRHQVFDLIALPGGLPGANHLRDCPSLIAMLQEQKQADRFYGAVCASPAVVLASHGLERDVRSTAHPAFTAQLHQFDNCRTVWDGMCITSQGAGTSLEFALTLVEALLGAEKREEVAGLMVV